MPSIILATGNDVLAQRQFVQQAARNPNQLDMFFVYDEDGIARCFGLPSLPVGEVQATSLLKLDTAAPNPVVALKCVTNEESTLASSPPLESENWRVQELMDNGAWSSIDALEHAREELREEIFACSGYDRSEVSNALRDVATRLRELQH